MSCLQCVRIINTVQNSCPANVTVYGMANLCWRPLLQLSAHGYALLNTRIRGMLKYYELALEEYQSEKDNARMEADVSRQIGEIRVRLGQHLQAERAFTMWQLTAHGKLQVAILPFRPFQLLCYNSKVSEVKDCVYYMILSSIHKLRL